MSEIEKIQRYIDRTKVNKPNYSLRFSEWVALGCKADEDTLEIIALAFDYGMAKGYRAAKAKGKA